MRAAFGIFLGLFFLVVLAGSLLQPVLIYGDPLSDANVLAAGENFARFGFQASSFLPRFERRDVLCLELHCAYTHYPPLPYWINGVWQKAGIHNWTWFRLGAWVLSFLGLGFFYAFLKREFGSAKAAACGVLVWALHPDFLRYADSLQQFSMNFFVIGAFAFFWQKFLRDGLFRHLALCFALYFLACWTTFELFPYLGLLALGLALLQNRFKQSFVPLAVLAVAPFATLFLRIWHQSLWFGTWDLAVKDLLHSAQVRSSVSLGTWLDEFQKRFLQAFLPVLIGFGWMLYKKGNLHHWRTALVFLIAGLSWWVLMPQHFAVHYHTVHLLLPAAAVIGAGLFSHVSRVVLLAPAVLVAMKSPQFNRWLPVDHRQHAFLSDSETDLQQLKVWLNSRSVSSLWVSDDLSHVAVSLPWQFRFFSGDCSVIQESSVFIGSDDSNPCPELLSPSPELKMQRLSVYVPSEHKRKLPTTQKEN